MPSEDRLSESVCIQGVLFMLGLLAPRDEESAAGRKEEEEDEDEEADDDGEDVSASCPFCEELWVGLVLAEVSSCEFVRCMTTRPSASPSTLRNSAFRGGVTIGAGGCPADSSPGLEASSEE